MRSHAAPSSLSPAPSSAHPVRIRLHDVHRRPVPSRKSGSSPKRGPTARPSLELARSCAYEASSGASWESYGLLFLAGCALALLTGCAIQMERFVAHWDSFESFVRALVA